MSHTYWNTLWDSWALECMIILSVFAETVLFREKAELLSSQSVQQDWFGWLIQNLLKLRNQAWNFIPAWIGHLRPRMMLNTVPRDSIRSLLNCRDPRCTPSAEEQRGNIGGPDPTGTLVSFSWAYYIHEALTVLFSQKHSQDLNWVPAHTCLIANAKLEAQSPIHIIIPKG